jgi:hypothetical protein
MNNETMTPRTSRRSTTIATQGIEQCGIISILLDHSMFCLEYLLRLTEQEGVVQANILEKDGGIADCTLSSLNSG